MNNPIMSDLKKTIAQQGWKFFDSGAQCTGYYALPPYKSTEPILFQFTFEENCAVNYVLAFRDIPEGALPLAAEFVLRTNAIMVLGSFELDYAQHSVRFKYVLENEVFANVDENRRGAVADRFLRLPYQMIDAVWLPFHEAISGKKKPEEAVRDMLCPRP